MTREDDWKEMKFARVFKADSIIPESNRRNFIKRSTYVAHLGGHHPFFNKLEVKTDRLKSKVWICDGAKWIWNRVEAHYPERTQILDYYHASEKLHMFAREAIKDENERYEWTEKQKELLLEGFPEIVLSNIELLVCKGRAQHMKRSLQTYYENNLKRMDYKKYRDNGLLIGSGPMEAAHRHVIQSGMKLSGQRWTIKGAQQIANLRVTNKNGDWKKVVQVAKLNG